ncbi:MAG: hypothetical protein JXB48_16210 [Candidatus Latescibacteria bacterium]|nr:hypothetical protein [Candidatus Latescibacterota bacterium]
MSYIFKKLPHVFVLLFAVIFTSGCFNIFGFTSDKEKSPVAKAEEAIRDGDYTKARLELEDDIENTDDSMVLYTYAKAVLLEADLDVATIVDLVQGETKVDSGSINPILDKFDMLDLSTQNAWYKSNLEVSRVLYKIWAEQTIGDIDKDDIALDYSVASVMSSILGLRDINQDQSIDPNVDFDLDLISIDIDGDGGFILGDIMKDSSGNPIIDEKTGKPKNAGLTAFLGNSNAKMSGISAETIKPDDINPFINFILTKLGEGENSIRYLINKYIGDSGSSIDYNEIEKYIVDIGVYVNYFWYNDGQDNDGDFGVDHNGDGIVDGGIDEETINGFDDDGDGLVDEDTHYDPAGEIKVEITNYLGMFDKWKSMEH